MSLEALGGNYQTTSSGGFTHFDMICRSPRARRSSNRTRRSSNLSRRSSCQKYEKIMKNIGNFNEFYISLIPYCERIFRIRSELRRGLFELRRVLILSSAGFNLSSAGLLDYGMGSCPHTALSYVISQHRDVIIFRYLTSP